MLPFAMLSLVCALSFAIFGYGEVVLPSWIWSKSLSGIFFALSLLSFVGVLFEGRVPSVRSLSGTRRTDSEGISSGQVTSLDRN